MKTTLLFAAFAVVNLAAAQKTTQLKEFKSLTIGSDVHVTLVKSNQNKLVVEKVRDEEPKIDNEGNSLSIKGGENAKITVYYTGALENITAASDAKIYCKDEIKVPSLTITAASDAVVELNVNLKKLSTAANSDAKITLTGKAEDHTATYASDAQLNARTLVTENTSIVMSADASAEISAKGIVNATVASDASLKIYGNPKKVNEVKSSDAVIEVVR